MTNLEQFEEMLKSANIIYKKKFYTQEFIEKELAESGYKDQYNGLTNGGTQIRISQSRNVNVSGYSDFFTIFWFNHEGKLCTIGIWE